MLWNLPSIKLKIGLWRQLGGTADVAKLPISTPSLTIMSCVEIGSVAPPAQSSRDPECVVVQPHSENLALCRSWRLLWVQRYMAPTLNRQSDSLFIPFSVCSPSREPLKSALESTLESVLLGPQWASRRLPLKIFVRSAFPLQQLVLDLAGKSKDLVELKELKQLYPARQHWPKDDIEAIDIKTLKRASEPLSKMKLIRELMRKQQLERQVHAWCWRTNRAESSWRGCKEWGKQLSILSSEYLGLKQWPQQIPGKTSEISVHKRAVLGIAKKPCRTLPLVEDTHITSHPSCLKLSYRKSDQAMKSRICPDP